MEKKKILPVTILAGSSVSNILAYTKAHKIQQKYYAKFALTFLVSSALEVLNSWQRFKWNKRIREYRMHSSPVFIVGFWRNGTTLLHNLLCQDDKAGYTTNLQAAFPHIILTQKKWLKKITHGMTSSEGSGEKKLSPDLPQDEEYGMTNVIDSGLYKLLLFPGDFEKIVSEALDIPQKDPDHAERWKSAYRLFIAKSMLNTGGSHYVGKNPWNMFRINLIKEIYPDARFIFLHRSPYQVVEALYQFCLSSWPGVQLQDVPPQYTREKIVLLYRNVLESYFSHRTHLHSRDLMEIRMDDFLNDKIGTIKKIYAKFGICGFEKVRPKIEQYLRENPSEETHFYQVHPETVRLVNQHASAIVRRLGYRMQHSSDQEVSDPAPAMA